MRVDMLIDLLMFILFLCILFIPTFVAYNRNLKRRLACFWVNLLFGWTIIVWIPLLIWSMLTSATET